MAPDPYLFGSTVFLILVIFEVGKWLYEDIKSRLLVRKYRNDVSVDEHTVRWEEE